MLAKVTSCALIGLDGALVEVEVNIANGICGIACASAFVLHLYGKECSEWKLNGDPTKVADIVSWTANGIIGW